MPGNDRNPDLEDPSSLRLLVADDHELVLDMLAHYLSSQAGMAVRTARSLDEADAVLREEGPFDLVLLDLNMPGMNGLAGLHRIIAANGGRPVAILTGNPVTRMVDDIFAAGASGVLLKTASARTLTNAIRFMHSGEQYLPRELMRHGARQAAARGLTSKEIAVLDKLAAGQKNKEIAMGLTLTEPTVKMLVTAICRKLGARNRTQAVVIARDTGLL